jgi:excisionase family DNA binding protein
VADEPKEFLDTHELAEWLGVPEYTVTREAREGRLPARKVGRGWRFSRTAILEHFRGSDAAPADRSPQPAEHPGSP